MKTKPEDEEDFIAAYDYDDAEPTDEARTNEEAYDEEYAYARYQM